MAGHFFMSDAWYVYLLLCSDNTYDTGISQHPDDRLQRHNAGMGPVYTQKRLPVKRVYKEILFNQNRYRESGKE